MASLVYGLLLFAVVGSILLTLGGLTVFSEQLNMFVFNRKHVFSPKQKMEVVKILCIWVGAYLFILVTLIMSLRIFSGKFDASSGKEPKAISSLNRILTNTIQQSAIFACLYGALLLNEGSNQPSIRGDKILVLASLFVIGRLTYSIGYMIGAAIDLMSFRSFGFGVTAILNFIMVAYHFGFNIFGLLDKHVAPIFKDFI